MFEDTENTTAFCYMSIDIIFVINFTTGMTMLDPNRKLFPMEKKLSTFFFDGFFCFVVVNLGLLRINICHMTKTF